MNQENNFNKPFIIHDINWEEHYAYMFTIAKEDDNIFLSYPDDISNKNCYFRWNNNLNTFCWCDEKGKFLTSCRCELPVHIGILFHKNIYNLSFNIVNYQQAYNKYIIEYDDDIVLINWFYALDNFLDLFNLEYSNKWDGYVFNEDISLVACNRKE